MAGDFRAMLDEVIILLDAGVMIYRRHVSSFLALAGIFSLPAMTITFQLLFTIEDLFEASVEDILLLTSSLLLVPLLMTPPLIRAMQLVLAGHPPSLRNVIWQRPQIGRGLLAVGYSGLLAMMWMTIFFVIFGFFFGISCGVIFFVLYIILFVSVMTNSLFGALFLPLLLFLFLVTYLLYFVFVGAGLLAALYGAQPLLDRTLSLRKAFRVSWSLLFTRFGYNLLVFICAALIFSAIALIVTVAIGVLLPVPFGLLLGTEHPLTRGLSAIAWVIGLAVAMPLVPIWSTLHYQQALIRYTGRDLAHRVAVQQQKLVGQSI
ncbi:hypothetical protein [Chloroflexus sp. MS-G]|uniref:hypothetical protein n=1 Tax=Chloroflexus sp. MS-G TaxID=1521187 RepID=UPI0004DF8180|nr:hypothetical protein [Chloroflexus sp. MS-G]